MMLDGWEQALEIVVARTGHERFRTLCTADWPTHLDYRRTVLRMAGMLPAEPEHAAAVVAVGPRNRFGLAWLAEVNTCLYRECRTGCQLSRCWAGKGTRWATDEPWGEATLADCRKCLQARKDRPDADLTA
jgi:hypothetical protein